jgi:hypothetical protein
MRPASLALCLVAGSLAGFTLLVRAEDKPAPFLIDYTHAGLTDITVKDGKLHYVWHTQRLWDDDKAGKPDQQSLANYDRHQVNVWLTDKELGQFRNWVARHKVSEFDKDYPSASGGKSYGAAFQSGLTVVQGDNKHGIAWVGDSKTPEALGVAVKELLELAGEIEKSRRK